MQHEQIKLSCIHKPDDEIEPEADYTPLCDYAIRWRNPNCNHLDADNPVSNSIITVCNLINTLCFRHHTNTLTQIRTRWRESMEKRDAIDKKVVELLPSARRNIFDANAVNQERERHASEVQVVQKICEDLHALAVKILEEVEAKL